MVFVEKAYPVLLSYFQNTNQEPSIQLLIADWDNKLILILSFS